MSCMAEATASLNGRLTLKIKMHRPVTHNHGGMPASGFVERIPIGAALVDAGDMDGEGVALS
jgi:hypothetical protein